MAQFLENLLTASIHGSVVILAVILLRFILQKTPRKFICLLWLLAGIRLLMPIEIRSELSLQPEPEPIIRQVVRYEVPDPESHTQAAYPFPESETVSVSPAATESAGTVPVEPSRTAPSVPSPSPVSFSTVVPWVWSAVCACFLLYTLCSYTRLRLLVREAVKTDNVWECDRIETAFILGFIRPRIYIPMGLSPMVRRHILAHEHTHLEKGDHWFKLIGFLVLSLHWFNPLVWIAYILLCRDIEMACDERVVQFMDLPERKEYSAALLNCSANNVHFAACPVAFGEVSVKQRIRSVLKYRKPGFWISLAGVIAIVFVAICLVTSPTESPVVSEETYAGESVTVRNIDELLEAIGPNKEILLQPGTYDLSSAKNYGKEPLSAYYTWCSSYDGYELVLHDIESLIIRGSGRLSTTLQTDPRWANVLRVLNCSNLTLEGFTAGHTRERGECSGGVVYLENCQNVAMHDLGLYGCGVVGLTAQLCSDVRLTGSEIYECSSSAVSLLDSTDVTVSGCRVYEIGLEDFGGYTFVELNDSRNIAVENCEFSHSTLNSLLVSTGSQVTFRKNLFSDNRARASGFSITGPDVILDSNRFQGNSIRSWYSGYGNVAFDAHGDPLMEEDLHVLYPSEPRESAQPQLQLHVSTVDELIAAIGPNTEIILDGELYDLSTATGYGTSSGDYYYWEDIFDGPGLVIRNVENMTIRSHDGNAKKHTIAAIPRYADVLAFQACANISLSGFTAGHTREPGSCMGGVIEFRDCDNMAVDNCGLYGCGILGVYAEYSQNIHVTNCEIYECSQGGIQMRNTNAITIQGNSFRDLGGEPTSFISCTDITMDGQTFNPQTPIRPIPPDVHAAVADEEDVINLGHAVTAFADAMFRGDEATMRMHLVSDYAFPLEIPKEVLGATLSASPDLPADYARDMETMGCCTVCAYYELPRQDSGIYSPEALTLEMCRENGIWKVQYFTTGLTEVAALDKDLYNFLYAYTMQDPQMLEMFLADSYTGTADVYFGNGDSVYVDGSYTVGDTFSNAQLAQLNTYCAAIPFKKSADSDSTLYLNVALQRRENRKTYSQGNYTRTDSEWVVLDYGMEPAAESSLSLLPEGISIEYIEAGNYTGVVMLVSDPSRVFLGTSVQGDFSIDIPGKQIHEMFAVYPDALGAVNAGEFYDDGTDSMASGSFPIGLVIAQGALRDSPSEEIASRLAGFAGFNSRNELVVSNRSLTAEEAFRLDIRDGCGIGPALIIQSEVQPGAESNSGYAPRTAIGQKADGTVILLCINGRVFNALGASYADVTREMMRYGAVNACMMHGGNATSMMYRSDSRGVPQLLTSVHTMSGDSQLPLRRLPTYWMVK